jgi:hypothetical protein
MQLLYYWRDFAENTRGGPIFKLNQRNDRIAALRAGDTVWAIASDGPGRYVLAARFVVEESGTNPLGDPDRDRYGDYFFRANGELSRYFNPLGQASAESLIRSLSIKTDAEHLGQAFQGLAAVRPLTEDDDRKLSTYADGL